MKIVLQERNSDSLCHHSLVHKFIPMSQTMRIANAKAATRKEWEKSIFVTLMDICHLKNALEPKIQKYKGRIVLRGDTVKDDSDSYAVFAEQDSSASQMTVAKVMDVIAKLPRYAGQAADAVSVCNRVKIQDTPRLFQTPESGMSRRLFGYVFHDINGRAHGQTLKIQWSSRTKFVRNSTYLSEVPWKLGWKKVLNWDCMFVYRKQGLFLSVNKDDINMTGKKQKMTSMWEGSCDNVYLGEIHIISWSRKLWIHSARKQIERKYWWVIQKNKRFTNLGQSNWKVHYEYSFELIRIPYSYLYIFVM